MSVNVNRRSAERADLTPSISVVILGGGASRRMGRDKRLLPWDRDPSGVPRTMLESIVAKLGTLSDDLILAANDRPGAGPARIVPDAYPGAGSLGGLYSGLSAARHDAAFMCAADMPLLDLNVVRALIARLETADAVVPIVHARPEPLHAIYGRTLLAAMRERIEAHQLKIAPLFDAADVVWVPESDLRVLDPDLRSFQNVNTPQEYAAARLALDEG